MRKFLFGLIACMLSVTGFTQQNPKDSALTALAILKDSVMKAVIQADSLRINKEFAEKEKFIQLQSIETFPLINAGIYSGVLPVKNPEEIPDPNLQYKLLFEVTQNNPDSTIGEMNDQLVEIARIINLHIASGIPLKKISPVIIVHAAALNAITTNKFYRKKYNRDNPNLKLVDDLVKAGANFIACGQAMQFFNVPADALLPVVRVSITAQTALSSYQLKGYVYMSLK
jgi:intracellular sulfur oxidation DsrE/DsrF family protein